MTRAVARRSSISIGLSGAAWTRGNPARVRVFLAQQVGDSPVGLFFRYVAGAVGSQLVQGRLRREPVIVAVTVEMGRTGRNLLQCFAENRHLVAGLGAGQANLRPAHAAARRTGMGCSREETLPVPPPVPPSISQSAGAAPRSARSRIDRRRPRIAGLVRKPGPAAPGARCALWRREQRQERRRDQRCRALATP